jgi:ribonuclease HI
MSTQTFGAAPWSIAVHNENRNPLHYRCLLIRVSGSTLFCTENCTMPRNSQTMTMYKIIVTNQIIVLTSRPLQRILAHSGQAVMSDLVAYVDGGSLGNPGPSGIGVVINGCESGEIRIAKWIGHQDNNVAEYAALMEALQCALAMNATKLHVYSDSEVMVRQMRGEYTCRSPRLYSLHWTCRKLARSLSFSISHVPRENNAEANGLANSAVRRRS